MTSPHIYRLKLERGMLARVARTTGVGRSHVSRVVSGERRSARIEKAIRSEIARIARLVEKHEREQQKQALAVAA